MSLRLEVLISCMFQNGNEIINNSNIQTDALVINQCDDNKFEEFHFINKKGNKCHVRIIHTKERGLSRSRNMALKHAKGDIILFCDDDELLDDNYEKIIIDSFEKFPIDDIHAFKFNHPTKKYSNHTFSVGYFRAPKISSWQIAIINSNKLEKVRFCEKMGSGTGNGGGEENKFIIDCLKNKFKIRYIPYLIGKVSQTESRWFHGHTKKYWQDRGWVAKMIYGKILGYMYLCYTLFLRSWKIDKNHSFYNIFIWLHQGFFEHR